MSKKRTYTQPATRLPMDVAQKIRADYEGYANMFGSPWGKKDATRRMYISSVLNRCVAAVNRARPNSPKLQIHCEYEALCSELDAAGFADFVVTKKDRVVLVIMEAKNCDMEQGRHQTFFTMEALRVVNKLADKRWHAITAICTDLQSWLFIQRRSGSLKTEDASAELAGNEFPEGILPMCEKVYGMLFEL